MATSKPEKDNNANNNNNNANNNNNNNFINEEEIPEIFHDLTDEILPETHKAMEEIADFLEKGAVDLLAKVENIPREHPIELETSTPQSAQEAANLPESIRLRRAIQALACICRDAKKDLTEVSAKIEDTRDELDETLEEFEQDLEKERAQRAKEVARLQKKIDQIRDNGGGNGSPAGGANRGGSGNNNDEDQEHIQELEDELSVLRKQLQTEKQLRRQEAQDRADDAKRIRASAEATFQANTENLRNQVSSLRQQLDARSAEERTKGQNVNDMALLVAKISQENTMLHEQKEQLDALVKDLLAQKAAQPPPTREAAIMEAEIQKLTAQLEETTKRNEETVAALKKRLTDTETALEQKLQDVTIARDTAQSALSEAETSRDAIRKNVENIRAEYQSMLESERKSHATALELALTEAATYKQALEHERNALRTAETRVFELSLQEERLTMEINALKVRLLHAEHETETANRRLNNASIGGNIGGGGGGYSAASRASSSSLSTTNTTTTQQQPLSNIDFSSLDSKELARQLQGSLARNEELNRALSEADKKIYNLQLASESSRHAAKFEIDDAERRAEEARKQLLHTERQHEMVVSTMNERKEAYLNRCVGTQAIDAEKDEVRKDIEDLRAENDNLQTQLEEAFEQQRVMRENLETKLTSQSSEAETTIRTLTEQLRSTRFRFNKTQARLNQVETEHATMSAEYNDIAEALQKADVQFRTAERELVDLNLENTSLRNKLKQMQREVEDLRLAMQMRERELELEYASNLKMLQGKIVSSMKKQQQPQQQNNNNNSHDSSSGELLESDNGYNKIAAKNSARPLFQQLSPNNNNNAAGDEDNNIVVTELLHSDHPHLPSSHHETIRSESAKTNDKIRQLDDIILQIQGDTLQLDRQERATRDQHMSTSQKLKKDIQDLEDRLSNLIMTNGGNTGDGSSSAPQQQQQQLVGLRGMIDEKRNEMVRLDDAMEKFVTQVREKRRKLNSDTASVIEQKEKLLASMLRR